jgi:hypothetical protein
MAAEVVVVVPKGGAVPAPGAGLVPAAAFVETAVLGLGPRTLVRTFGFARLVALRWLGDRNVSVAGLEPLRGEPGVMEFPLGPLEFVPPGSRSTAVVARFETEEPRRRRCRARLVRRD